MENKENIPFPDKLVSYWDIVRGVGQVVFHSVFDQFRHETPSEHFRQPKQPENQPELPFNDHLDDMEYINPPIHDWISDGEK